ncbi:PepSY domain-containing protein [Bacillus tuaregi]|uniref:PepSY domain-containing protein n=1 Tax=Bacillus tuaregi TaxID=1816695 RepID=UPI0008F93CD7|nr:PepSY domain-containing protein [Bacillus tuaregi]
MNWKTFLTGVGSGVAIGIILNQAIDKNKTISAEKALANAKAAFKKHGPITGSWIQMEKQPYSKSFLEYEVYIGGISRNVDGQNEQYEFIVDTSTGAILDAYPLS